METTKHTHTKVYILEKYGTHNKFYFPYNYYSQHLTEIYWQAHSKSIWATTISSVTSTTATKTSCNLCKLSKPSFWCRVFFDVFLLIFYILQIFSYFFWFLSKLARSFTMCVYTYILS